jgi:hypothetical protein
MNTIAIDFESTFGLTKNHGIREQGTWAYLQDPLTDVYLVSIVADTGFEFCGHPSEFDWASLNGNRILSHNASFDECVCMRLQELGVIPKDWSPAEYHCTADLSSFCAGPRALKDCAQFWLGKKVDKSVRDNAKKRTWESFDENERSEMTAYALEDSRSCLALWELLSPRWPQEEREISRINREIGFRGVHIDRPKLETYIAHLEKCLAGFRAQIPWADTRPPLSPIAVRDTCAELGIPAPKSMAKTSEDFSRWLEKYKGIAPWAEAMSQWRSANALAEKLKTMHQRIREDGTMPVAFKYYGAFTGRFSGDGGLNLQNAAREKMFEIVAPREVIVPAPGNVFLIVDLSQVEVRGLHYLANKLGLGDGSSARMLDLLRSGSNPYEAQGVLAGVWSGVTGSLKKKDPKLYSSLKAQVLGAGYGVGAEKFAAIAPILSGGAYTPTLEEAAAAVQAYRAANSDVVNLWWKMDRDLRTAASRKTDYVVELPSGHSLIYRKPRLIKGDYSRDEVMADVVRHGKIVGNRVRGPLIVENATQSMCRHAFAQQLVEMTRRGFDLKVHIHDEAVVECPKEAAEDRLKELIEIMSTAPPWAPDLPLAAEGGIHPFYTK